MDTGISLAQFVISSGAILISSALGLIKYIDYKTGIAEDRLRAEIAEIRAAQNTTQQELRKISENLLEIRAVLFGAFKQPGVLQKLLDDKEN